MNKKDMDSVKDKEEKYTRNMKTKYAQTKMGNQRRGIEEINEDDQTRNRQKYDRLEEEKEGDINKPREEEKGCTDLSGKNERKTEKIGKTGKKQH